MAKRKIYQGRFYSRDGVRYDLSVYAESTAALRELTFPADTPIEVEWSEVDKLAPVQGSSMTLTVQSLSDRQFVDLYTVEAGSVRADIHRDGVLYWSGTLDTELYEEPYSELRDYDVTFTFSDFALLDRMKWDRTGVCSIQEVIDTCVAATGIQYRGIQKRISTKLSTYGQTVDLAALSVLCDNFYDEEGEPMTMREVLEGVLRPFALRLVQKGGYLHLFDLNAVYDGLAMEEVYWRDTDACLGVDSVYNDVRVTFSPYADAELIDGSLNHEDLLPEITDGESYLMDNDWANAADGFTLFVGEQADLPLTLSNGAKFFRIDSDYSGSDEAGVVWAYKSGGQYDYSLGRLNSSSLRAMSGGSCIAVPIIITRQAFVGHVVDSWRYNLKITLDLLFDVRYNPFEGSSVRNEEGNWERLNDWCNFGYVPVMLYLKDSDGNILYHYRNKGVMNQGHYKHTSSNCGWVAGAGNWGEMWLCYYDWEDRKSATGFGGWQTNKPIIGYYRERLPKKWQVRGDGEFIEMPPVGGYLELQVGRGIYQFDYKREEKDIYSIARWLMYKEPAVTLVKGNGTAVSLVDIEDAAWLSRAAKEELPISTVVGTAGLQYIPSARGIVMGAGGSTISQFARAGTEGRLERLLIGTAYSQYAARHNTLSGTARLLPDMKLYTDASASGKYILLSEVQDLADDSSQITMVELSPENYEGVEMKR